MKIKRFISAFLISALAFSFSFPALVAAEEIVTDAQLTMGSIKIFVNGKRVHKQTLLYNDSTYLPLRALAEALSKEILYDPVTVTAHINSTHAEYPPSESGDDIDTVRTLTETIYLGRTKLMVDGVDVPQETLLYNDSAYAPLRAVAELLNMEVSYDDSIKSAMLYDKGTPEPQAPIVYLEKYPTVIDLAAYAGIAGDSPKISEDAGVTTILYLNIPAPTIVNYVEALKNDGFALAEEQQNPDIYVLAKGNVTVTIDNHTYKSPDLLLMTIQEIDPFVYPEEFPDIPLFSPEKPVQTAMTADGRGIIYSYINIAEAKVAAYIEELTRIGFEHNSVLSAVDYNVYNLNEFSVTVDLTKQSAENKIAITIKNEIFLFQKEFPTIPTFAGIKPENTTPSEDGKGSVYWYKGATEETINQYIKELSRLGYVTDAGLSKAGYYVYKLGDATVYIDTNTYKSTSYVLLIITKEITVVYYPNYSTVPSFPARIETTSLTDDGAGTVYWHLNVSGTAINEYAEQIVRLGFVKNDSSSRDGYLVFTKADISVTLDSVTRAANGFFLLEIKNITPLDTSSIPFVAYSNHPTVPDIGTFVNPHAQPLGVAIESEYVEVYRYSILSNEAIQKYLKYLIDNKFVNIPGESRDGFWVFEKNSLLLTVDTLSQPGLHTFVKIDTSFVVRDYPNMSGVPDFRSVIRNYWDMPSDRVDLTNGYIYSIREGSSGSVSGYTGDVSLFNVYTDYLEASDFVKDPVQLTQEPAQGETRHDITYFKAGIRIIVSESTVTAENGNYTNKISIISEQ